MVFSVGFVFTIIRVIYGDFNFIIEAIKFVYLSLHHPQIKLLYKYNDQNSI